MNPFYKNLALWIVITLMMVMLYNLFNQQHLAETDISYTELLAMVDEERPTILIFLTDGLPTVGEIDVDRIIDNVGDAAPQNARIFPFGVGYDVNTMLLDTVAQNRYWRSRRLTRSPCTTSNRRWPVVKT